MICQPVYANALQVAESWAFGMLVLFAGLLPDPTRAVASTSIAFNTYGITYMPFLAESIAVSTRCGHSSIIHSLLSSCVFHSVGTFYLAASYASATNASLALRRNVDVQGG